MDTLILGEYETKNTKKNQSQRKQSGEADSVLWKGGFEGEWNLLFVMMIYSKDNPSICFFIASSLEVAL